MINLFYKRKKLNFYHIFGIHTRDLLFKNDSEYLQSSLVLNVQIENIQRKGDSFILWDENTSIHYSGNLESIVLSTKTIQNQIAGFGNTSNIEPAFVYELDERLEDLIINSKVRLLHGKYLLLKYPSNFSASISKLIFLAQAHNIRPIIILPHELIIHFNHQKDGKRINQLLGRHCAFQLNYLYVKGYYGSNAQRLAQYLLDSGNTILLGIKYSEFGLIEL